MAHWIIEFIQSWGLPAVAALMVLENVFPPIPSELIMPFAGFVAARGDLSTVGVLAAGTLGSVLGTLPWYLAGHWLSMQRLRRWTARHGRWLAASPGDLDRACNWFERHGERAVLLGRMVPAVRSVISVPAGLTHMPLTRFLLWSVAGSMLWVGVLVALGYLLDNQYERVAHWLDPVTKVIIAVALTLYVWRVARFKPQPADEARGEAGSERDAPH